MAHYFIKIFKRLYLYTSWRKSSGGGKTYRNIFITFLIGGIWHGANWTFIIWGIMHGIGSVINRIYKNTKLAMPMPVAWMINFLYINIAWVFFGAENFSKAKYILFNAVNIVNFDIPRIYFPFIKFRSSGIQYSFWILVLIPVLIYFIFNDTFRKWLDNFTPVKKYSIFIIIILLFAIFQIIKPDYSSPFIYFNF